MNLTKPNHRILVVDDNEAIHGDLRKVLGRGPQLHEELAEDEAVLFNQEAIARVNFEVESAFQGQEGLALVQESLVQERPYAMAFIDVRMPPGWDGIETAARIWEICPDLQVVLCTAYSDYSWEEITRRLGRSENLLILKKPFDNIEVIQLAHALTNKWLLGQQARARMEDLDRLVARRTAELQAVNESLRLSEERFAKAFAGSPIPLAIQTLADARFVDVNQRFLETTGLERQAVLQHTDAELGLWGTDEMAAAWQAELHKPEDLHERPCVFVTRSGEPRQALASTEIIQIAGAPHRLLMLLDISERLAMEKRLRHAEKLEAIGQLSGGIAHHLNNYHTVIQGHLELCLLEIQDPSLRESLQAISTASQRAVGLVRQMLAFSSRQALRSEAQDFNQLLANFRPFLEPILGSGIRVELELAHSLPEVMVDGYSIEQVLIHLCRNARDAMPNGGRLLIRTEKFLLAHPEKIPVPDLVAGAYVCMSIMDTGVGMDRVTLTRMFEPFFTTKEISQRSGLGLATVYGIVRQHLGWIEAESEPGKGSVFRVYLPAA